MILDKHKRISFDLIVETMYETGKDLGQHYRETSDKYAHAPAAIEQAVPISAWQPHSAPLIDALVLTTFWNNTREIEIN